MQRMTSVASVCRGELGLLTELCIHAYIYLYYVLPSIGFYLVPLVSIVMIGRWCLYIKNWLYSST